MNEIEELYSIRDSIREGTRRLFAEKVKEIIDEAYFAGLVITVQQVPTTPLAMGHYETQIIVRDSRDTYGAR